MAGADAARRECGVSFVTMASSRPQPTAKTFRRQGLLQGHEHGGKRRSSCRTRTLCTRERPPTPILPLARSDWKDRYDLPPCATVTLEKVEQPGEWGVRGHKVRQRLFISRDVEREVVVVVRRACVVLARGSLSPGAPFAGAF